MLLGPFPINSVDAQVSRNSPGVYVLSRDGRTAAYVGRSDNDVGSRIKESAGEGYGYTHFWFEWASSAMGAYQAECEYFHKYGPRANTVHPAVPLGTNWRCPVAGCPWS